MPQALRVDKFEFAALDCRANSTRHGDTPRASLPNARSITSMFDIGWSELLVIGVVAIVVVGPKELPRLMRTFGHYTGKLRAMAGDFQRQFEDAVRDSEIDEVRKAMQDFMRRPSDANRAEPSTSL